MMGEIMENNKVYIDIESVDFITLKRIVKLICDELEIDKKGRIMKTFFVMILLLANIAVASDDGQVLANSEPVKKENCPCPPKPKRRPVMSPRLAPVFKYREPQQRQEQDQENEQEQDQNQHQTVNVHVHNQDNYRVAARLAAASRSRFKLGLHAGCGPTGVKRTQLDSNSYRYDLRNDMVIGASLSIRLLGPVWLTGQAFSNKMYTGGLEFEF